MPRPATAPLVLLAVLCLAASAHADDILRRVTKLSLPGKSWSLVIDLDGYAQGGITTRPDGRAAMLEAESPRDGVTASVLLESRPDLDSTEACRRAYWAKAARSSLPALSVEQRSLGSLATVHWMRGKEGDTLRERHVNAYLYRDGVCIEVRFSRFPPDVDDEARFAMRLGTVRFSDDAPRVPAAPARALAPAERDPNAAEAALARGWAASVRGDLPGSERYYREAVAHAPDSYMAHSGLGHALYYQQRFAEAIPEFERARAIGAPKDERQTSRERVLNDSLGIALGLTRRLDEARVHFEAAIDRDPTFPMYHFNLACIHAELGDLDRTIASLEQAYAYEANMSRNRPLPDPRTDSSFARFLGNARFQAVLERLDP